MVHKHQLLETESVQKHRLSFAMQFANQLWQADTLHGPSIKQPGRQGKTRGRFQAAFSHCPITGRGARASKVVSSNP